MQWLETSVRYMISLIGLSEQSDQIWEVFLYQFLLSITELSISFLLILFIVQYFMTFINADKIREKIEEVPPVLAHILAAIFGAVTPFCTCSGVPIFAGFMKSGVPAGVAFSFLITSPLVNTIALAGLWTVFGAKVAILYVFFGLVAGVLGGMILARFNVEELLLRKFQAKTCCGTEESPCCDDAKTNQECCESKETDCCDDAKTNQECCDNEEVENTEAVIPPRNRIKDAWLESVNIVLPVIPYLVIGSAIGIAITMGFSEEFVESLANYSPIVTIPLAILLGAPIYTSTIAILPVITSLYAKGLGIGVTFALLMSIGGMSFPEWSLLAGMMKKKLLFLFILVTGLLIMTISYLFTILEFFQII
ncbi:MAG: permease [Brevinema sp.]